MYNRAVQNAVTGRRRAWPDVWLPILIVVLGWAASAGTWWLLVTERRQTILESTQTIAGESSHQVVREVEAYLLALRDLAELWELVGRRPLAHWQADVDGVIDSFPALDFVAWTDSPDGAPRIRSASGQAMRSLPEPGPPQPGVDGPVRDRAGGPAFLRVVLPVGPRGERGLLVSRIDLDSLLHQVLDDVARSYAVRAFWGDEQIFSRGEASADAWQAWWRVEQTAALPHGIVWRLRHRPTPPLAATLLTPVPHYLLASGLVLSLLLAALVHQLRVTVRQSRFLAATNRALEERGGELERRVAERTRDLEEALNELRAFTQAISHDLRSPLGAVLNFTSILEEDYPHRPLDMEGLEMLARIRRSASRATALLSGLLRHSRAGRVTLSISPIEMRSLATEIFAQVVAAEGDDDVEFLAEELPPVEGDRSLLGDVFANLLTNALKYSRGREKRRITVRGSVQGDECIYEVADNGRGFDPRFERKLFGMFERLDPDDDVEGTGAGLAIVDRIVRRHGGRVWAEGRPDEGARFCFALPRKQEAGS